MSCSITLSGRNVEEIGGSQWDSFSKSVSPDLQFLTQDWYSTWERKHLVHAYPNSQVKYLSLFDAKNNLQGAFPHVEFSRLGLKILSVAGLYYPFRSLLFSSEFASDCAKVFVDTIHQTYRNNIIRIGPTVEDELGNKMIKKSFLALGWKCYENDRGNTLLINLPDSVELFRKILSKKFVKNIDRSKRNLSKLGEVEYSRFNSCEPEVWANVIDQCASVEKRSWLALDESAEMRISENSEFWKHYLECSDASQRAVVWLVSLNGEPIGYSFAIDSGDRRYSFSGHYDEKYKKYSPGILADGCMYEDAIDNGMKTVDMGTGEAEYKSRWGAKPGSKIIDYIFLPPNVLGTMAYSGIKLKKVVHYYAGELIELGGKLKRAVRAR